MKIAQLFAGAFIAGLLFSPTAQATTVVGLHGTNTVYANDYGIISDELTTGLTSGQQIVIDYTYTDLNPYLISDIAVGSVGGSTKGISASYVGSAWTLTPTGSAISGLSIAMSNLTASSITVTIQNLTGALATITSFFSAIVSSKAPLNIEYTISSVPLPASFLLFGSGLAFLGGFAARKKARE